MIQRIQSIYLLLALILMIVSFFLPLAEFSLGENLYELDVFGFSEPLAFSAPAMPFYLCLGFLSLCVLSSIFLFKNRKLQLRVNWISILLLLGLIIYIFYFVDKLELQTKAKYLAGVYTIVAALPFLILSSRAIKKDEDLVKSLDRIR
ncbi:MAG: DUF4293 domain-containing protein [Bacteroidota bacterium]